MLWENLPSTPPAVNLLIWFVATAVTSGANVEKFTGPPRFGVVPYVNCVQFKSRNFSIWLWRIWPASVV